MLTSRPLNIWEGLYCCIMVCKRTEEPGRLQSMESQRVGHDWSDLAHMHTCVYTYTRVLETGWHTWLRLRNGDLSPLLTTTRTLRLCPWVPASDTRDGTRHSAWYIAKATLTTISCRFMCRSDWNFLSWSQPIRLKMPSSGVGWGDIRDSPGPAPCHCTITSIQAEDTLCLSSSLTAAKIDSEGPRFDSIVRRNQAHHEEVQELFSLGF